MVTYNHEKYIAEAIEGVMTQKNDFPIELVIGEDCSTDNTRQICLEYKKKYPNKIKLLLPEKNCGVMPNFIETLKNCTGKYIAICEGDDYWIDPLKLQKQVDFLEKSIKTTYLFTNRKFVYTNKIQKDKEVRNTNRIYTTKDILAGFNPGLQSVCFRKEELNLTLFEKCMNFINGDRLLPYMLSLSGDIRCLQDCTAVYRITGLGVSTSVKKDKWFEHATADFYRFHKTLEFPNMACYAKGQANYVFGFLKTNIFHPVRFFQDSYAVLSSKKIKSFNLIYSLILFYAVLLGVRKLRQKLKDKTGKFFNKFKSTCFCSVIARSNEEQNINLATSKVIKAFNVPTVNLFNKAVTIADPFLFVNDNKLYVFYEFQQQLNSKGLINMHYSEDLATWSQSTTVLEENFHLSFPFVFEDKREIFMIPEAFMTNSIRLYKADKDLLHFSFVKILLEGYKFVDSSIYVENNIYYLFTSIQTPDNDYIQKLYYSDSLYGKWEEHPSSPISIGKSYERNGGAIFKLKNQLYRPAQSCLPFYGSNFHLFKIQEITSTNYVEVPYQLNVIPKRWHHSIGGHHYNGVTYQGQDIIALDLMKRSFNLYYIQLLFRNKFKNK
ncbi:hypothetical protein FACS1894182_06410 [Bacteroidia bacterium]|nr:hypothetical protein FACS1894182_06410 [Bacteroidia bacterium]